MPDPREAALGNVSGLDTEHLAEEVEDMGRIVRRELRSHLSVLMFLLFRYAYI